MWSKNFREMGRLKHIRLSLRNCSHGFLQPQGLWPVGKAARLISPESPRGAQGAPSISGSRSPGVHGRFCYDGLRHWRGARGASPRGRLRFGNGTQSADDLPPVDEPFTDEAGLPNLTGKRSRRQPTLSYALLSAGCFWVTGKFRSYSSHIARGRNAD